MRTYGKLWFDEKSKSWIVKAEPHITIRMKRVFERISKTEFGQITLADSDETRRELDWFLQRYNLEVADKDWTRILDGTERYKEEILTLEKIIDPNWKPRREITMAFPPRQYQLQAAEVLLERKFLLLGDDLGTGKTVSTITCFTEPRTLPAVVVTLAGILPTQWEAEVNRFMPALFTHVIKKRALYELPKRDGRGPDVLVINYAKLDSWAEVLAKYVNMIAFDECLRGSSQITMWPPNHTLPLTDLRAGDKIASFSESGSVLPDRVLSKKYKGRREVWRLTLEGGKHLDCTHNERLWTNYGWLYLRDIINALRAENKEEQADPAQGGCSSGVSWDASWGCQSAVAEGLSISKNDHETLPKAGCLLPSQGKNTEELRKDQAADREKWRLGQRGLLFCNSYYPGLRVFTLDVLSPRPTETPTEDGYKRMGSGAWLEGSRLLVHGRWRPSEKGRHCKSIDARILREGGSASGQASGGAWHKRHNRIGQKGCQKILDDTAPERTVSYIYHQSQEVRTPFDGLQGCDRKAPSSEAVFNMPGKDIQNDKASENDLRLLRQEKLHQDHSTGSWDLQQRHQPQITPKAVISVEMVGIDDVWDIETERHHTFFANGVAVHNCQELRHQGTSKYDAAVHVARHCKYALGNSGTPIFNYGGEIYNVMNVLKDGALGKYDEFFREWCTSAYGEKKISVRDPKALGTYLRENFLMLRRTRKDVGRELPPLAKIPHTVSVDMKALDGVKDSAFALAKLITSEQKLSGFEKMKASEELSHMLRQATGVAKSPYVADFVRMLVEEGSSVVVYAWHRTVYDIMAKKLEDLNPVMITGAESTKEKIASKKKFISGESKVLMISLRAGAGIDGLQKVSNTAVFAELDWSPGAIEQCIGRLFRDGQPDPVTAFFLVTEEGSDPTMSQALGLKTEQIEGLRNPDKELVETLQVDEDRIRSLAKNYLAKNKAKMEVQAEEEPDPQVAENAEKE